MSTDEENRFIIPLHPMVNKLQEMSKHKELVVKHADFDTGQIIVTMKGYGTSFEDMMESIKFVSLINRITIHAVNFKTGEFTVEWHENDFQNVINGHNITKEEFLLVKEGKRIKAIKSIRERTKLPLSKVSEAIDILVDEMDLRGIARKFGA